CNYFTQETFTFLKRINVGVKNDMIPTTTTKAPAIIKASGTPIRSDINPVNNKPIMLGSTAILKYSEKTRPKILEGTTSCMMVIKAAENIDIATPPKPVMMAKPINQLDGNHPDKEKPSPIKIC